MHCRSSAFVRLCGTCDVQIFHIFSLDHGWWSTNLMWKFSTFPSLVQIQQSLHSVCLSICVHETTWMTIQILIKFYILSFIKMCWHIQILVKIGQNNWHFTWRPTCAKVTGWRISLVVMVNMATLFKSHGSNSGKHSTILALCLHFLTCPLVWLTDRLQVYGWKACMHCAMVWYGRAFCPQTSYCDTDMHFTILQPAFSWNNIACTYWTCFRSASHDA